MNKLDLKKKQEALNAMKALNDACDAFGEFLLKMWQHGVEHSLDPEERAIIGAEISWDSSEGYEILNLERKDYLYTHIDLEDAIYIVEERVPFYRFMWWLKSKSERREFWYYDLSAAEYREKQKQCERVLEMWGLKDARESYRYGAGVFCFRVKDKAYKLYFTEVDDIERAKWSLDETIKYIEEQYREDKDRIDSCYYKEESPKEEESETKN